MKNYLFKNFVFITTIVLSVSCKSQSSFDSGTQSLSTLKTLYSAGSYASNPDSLAISWKNGLRSERSSNLEDAQILSTFVSNGNLYQGGYVGFRAALWVNGVRSFLSDGLSRGSVNSVYVLNGVVYAAGHDNGKAVLWKNGIKTVLTTNGIGSASSVFVKGDDVYLAGFENTGGEDIAVLWKNPGSAVERTELSDGSFDAYALSVFVSSLGKVYVAGKQTGAATVATLWVDSDKTELSDPTKDSVANVVFVSGNDVFVGGNEGNVSTIWKNPGATVETFPLSDGTNPASIRSLIKEGESLYAAGFENNGTHDLAVLWQGGEKQVLSDGSFDTVVNSLYVSGGDVYLGGSEIYSGPIISPAVTFKGTQSTLLDNDSEVKSLYVVNDDIYAVGTTQDAGVTKAAYWKNGTLVDSRVGAVFNSIVVDSAGDVFVGGILNNLKAIVWKNIGASEEEILLSDGSVSAGVNSLFLAGTDLYAAGFDGVEGAVWKNATFNLGVDSDVAESIKFNSVFVSNGIIYAGGIEQFASGETKGGIWNLTDSEKLYDLSFAGGSSIVRGIYVSGLDVYSVGSVTDATGSKAVLWKNNLKTNLSSDSSFQASAESIVVDGSDVYVGGYEGFTGLTWKNGLKSVLAIKNPGSTCKINSIFLK